MMVRTQIALDAAEHRRAKKKAADSGVSLAEYVRRLVDRDLGGLDAAPDPATLFDLGESGGSDVARNKDAYLAAALDR